MKNSDDIFLKDAIKSGFGEIDKGINASDFYEDWQQARADLEQQPAFLKKLFSARLHMLLKRSFFTQQVLVIAPLCLVIAAIFVLVRNGGPSDELDFPLSRSTREQIISLDPDKYWRAPTDELLQIDVRKYETHLITFVNYDPVSMEIR